MLDTPTRTLGYDLDGRLTSNSGPAGTQTYTYDDRSLPTAATGPTGNSAYAYDANGQLTARTNTAGTTSYTYDAAGQLKTLADPLTATTLTYGYTNRGEVNTVQYGTGDTRNYTYDDQGNTLTDTLKTTAGATVASLAYTYFPSGRLKTKTTTGVTGAATQTYTYDQAGRLGTWNNGASTTTYGYDGNGNLTANGINTATYNERNQLTATSTSTTYTYSPRGTRTAATAGSNTTTSTYDAFDQLAAQSGQTYSYDALGRLTQNTGHTFAYDGATSTLTADGTENYTRTPGGSLTALGTTGAAALAYTDRHGDLIGTFTPTATTTAGSTAYDPWGKPTSTTGTNHNLGYQGGWTDHTTGQVNAASRWYDAATAGFTTRDTANLAPTTSGIANRYTYGAGDPLNTIDPTGHNPCGPDPKEGPEDPDPRPHRPIHNRYADLNGDESNPAALWNSMGYGESSSWQEYSGSYYLTTLNLIWGTVPSEAAARSYSPAALGGAIAAMEEEGAQAGAQVYDLSAFRAARWQAALNVAEAEELAEGFAEEAASGYHDCGGHGPQGPPPPKHIDWANTPPGDNPNTGNTPAQSGLNGIEVGLTQPAPTAGDNPGAAPQQLQNGAVVGGQGENGRGEDCRNGFGTAWRRYSPVDVANGSRATGVEACLDMNFIKANGSGTKTIGRDPVWPPGYIWSVGYVRDLGNGAKAGNWRNACHLLAGSLGGDGDIYENIATCSRTANANPVDTRGPGHHFDNMASYEKRVKEAVEKGQIVHYVVTPQYDGTRIIPTGFRMQAYGYSPTGEAPISFDEYVPNDMYSLSDNQWHNMGQYAPKGWRQ